MQGKITHFLEEIILIFNKKIDEVLSTQTNVRLFHWKKVFQRIWILKQIEIKVLFISFIFGVVEFHFKLTGFGDRETFY